MSGVPYSSGARPFYKEVNKLEEVVDTLSVSSDIFSLDLNGAVFKEQVQTVIRMVAIKERIRLLREQELMVDDVEKMNFLRISLGFWCKVRAFVDSPEPAMMPRFESDVDLIRTYLFPDERGERKKKLPAEMMLYLLPLLL